MFPGGMEGGVGGDRRPHARDREQNLFRYYGVGDGPNEVAAFEREFADYVGTKYALCVNAGSSALICGLLGAGVGERDEVIVPAYTWNATPNAVLASRAVPVLAEVDESLTLDPADVEKRITPRTRAIVPCTCAARRRQWTRSARSPTEWSRPRRRRLPGRGRTFGGRRLGGFGDAGAFSLQFNKIITTVRAACSSPIATTSSTSRSTSTTARTRSGAASGCRSSPGGNFRASELTGGDGPRATLAPRRVA